MKELIDQFLKEKGDGLISNLTSKIGFSSEQATSFVPALLEKVSGLFSSGALNVGDVLQGLDVKSVLGKLDLSSMASQLGLASNKVEEGAEEVLNQTKDHVQGKMGDLGGLFGGEDGKGPDLGSLFK